MRHYLSGLLILLTLPASPLLADFESAVEAYRQNNYLGAMEAFMPLAEQGDARAQTVLALMYKYGEGTPLSLRNAFMWYKRAAELGYAPAQYHTGVMLADGIGVDSDLEGAIVWLTQSAQAGFRLAADKLETLNATQVTINPAAHQIEHWTQNWDFSLPNNIQFQMENDSSHMIEPFTPSFRVQLGAMSSKKSAVTMWDSLTQIDPALFEGFSLVVKESVQTNRTLYKVQTGHFDSIEQAKMFCSHLSEKIQSGCLPLHPIPENTLRKILPWDPALEYWFTRLIPAKAV